MQGRQKEWTIAYILKYIYQDSERPAQEGVKEATRCAARRRKLKKDFFEQGTLSQVREFHAQIWPGIDMPVVGSDADESLKLPERTVPTSVLIAMLAWQLAHDGKPSKTQARVHEVLKYLFSSVSQRGVWSVRLPEMRFFQVQDIEINVSGHMHGDALWGRGNCPRKDYFVQKWSRALNIVLHEAGLQPVCHCMFLSRLL